MILHLDELLETAKKAKMLITTIAFLFASMVGAYNIAGEYFVTKLYAQELIDSINEELNELKKQTKSNKHTLIEMQLMRLENKKASGVELTPTEVRVYKRLSKEYEEIMKEY